MLFNSPIFIFAFLPLSLVIYYITPKNLRNFCLLIFSCLFYWWGEPVFIKYLLLMILINFLTALFISYYHNRKSISRLFLIGGVLTNLAFLFNYKYSNFFLENLSKVFPHLNTPVSSLILPLAISFFTFHALSYLIDVYQKRTQVVTNPVHLGLYFFLFPHLLAGPIVRLTDIRNQFDKRQTTQESFGNGVSRFIIGLAKKVLIADTLAFMIDEIFSTPPHHLMPTSALLGVIAYTIQIYFDFSGYSDMAIGLALMFGFKFPENFNYPYAATSVTEFWRRWHMTLSSWFRDYLYYPIAHNWGRTSKIKLFVSLFVTFTLIGLWHGAGWKFIVFGMYQGLFLILERINFTKGMTAHLPLGQLIKHFYLIAVVMIGWVLFRSPNLGYSLSLVNQLTHLFDPTAYQSVYHPLEYFLRKDIALALIAGSILSLPVAKVIPAHIYSNSFSRASTVIILVFLFLLSVTATAVQTYNPFIYFRF